MFSYLHHIGDFNKATRHLSRVERSIYRDLIELYYETEKPLVNDLPKLCRLVIAHTKEEKAAVSQVLNEFFHLNEKGFIQVRCELEIEKYFSFISDKSKAGKVSAEKRKARRAEILGPTSTAVQQVFNTSSTELQQDANTDPTRTQLTSKPVNQLTSKPLKDNHPSADLPKNKFSDEDKKCAEWLIAKLQEFIPDCKSPNVNGWAEHVRKMREIDNRDHKDICQLWLWCRKDGFESANVQSPEKLRKRYDSLKIKMKNPSSGASYGNQPKPSLIDRFIANNYGPGTGRENDYGPMGSDDSVIRGEVVEPIRGGGGQIGPMETDLIGDFKAASGFGAE